MTPMTATLAAGTRAVRIWLAILLFLFAAPSRAQGKSATETAQNFHRIAAVPFAKGRSSPPSSFSTAATGSPVTGRR